MLTHFIKHQLLRLKAYIEIYQPPYVAFALFGVINYPSFYFVWLRLSPQDYTNVTMRLIAATLCFFLLFHRLWPKRLQYFLPFYWYLTIWYCLPFFVTFMFLKNNGSAAWQLNMMTALFFLIIMVDWLSFFVILISGIIAGYVLFTLVGGHQFVFTSDVFGAVSTFVMASLVGLVFSHNISRVRENIALKERIEAMETLGASVAHELRTPLSTIRSGVGGIRIYLNDLVATYKKAVARHCNVGQISPTNLKLIPKVLQSIQDEAKNSSVIIDMLLTNITHTKISIAEYKQCTMVDCIDEALKRYPFQVGKRELIHWDRQNNFYFNGSEILLVHVLFNLIKNALYFIDKAHSGEIYIRLERGDKFNKLYFKDTGLGISSVDLPHIFDRFYSKHTHRGTGIGLAFCCLVMEAHFGKIACHSREGEFTEFILTFPISPH